MCIYLTKILNDRLREYGRGYWIANVEPWCHPNNKVLNCISLSLDGFPQYKFSLKFRKTKNGGYVYYKVKFISTSCLDLFKLDVKMNDCITYEQLVDKIKKAYVKKILK